MMKTRKTLTTFLLGITMSFATCFGVMFSMPKAESVTTAQAETTYATKDIAMMGRVAGWYGNGNFEIRFTLGESDWSAEAQKSYVGEADLATALRKLGFFDKIMLGDKTLAEWGCTACYDNIYWLNSGEPDYTLTIPLQMSADNMAAASAAGIGANSPFTVLEGALIPSNAYLQGDLTATVYRAGCDYVSSTSSVTYGIESAGKTDVESVKYVQGYDGTCGYFGVSLYGDDYAGAQLEVVSHGSGKFAQNRFETKILVNGQSGVARSYGLYGLGGENGAGYFAFQMFMAEADMQTVTIPAGTTFPTRAMSVLRPLNGNNGVYMMYETTTDVTFYKQADGSWSKTNLEETKANAIAEIQVYKSDVVYFTEQASARTNAINTAVSSIQNAQSVAEVNSALSSAKATIDNLSTKAQIVANAKDEIANYKSGAVYEDAVADQKAEIIAQAIAAIDSAKTQSAVNAAVAEAKAAIDQLPEKTTYTTKDIAMMGRVAGWYGNGNFEIRFTLGEADWAAGSSAQKAYAGEADLATALKKLNFFDKIMLGDKTLAEWGCVACYDNIYWTNSGEPDYTLTIPLSMGSTNMAAASAAGIGANSPFTVLEGALIPSDAYLQGDTSAIVYRAGATFVTSNSTVAYGMEAVAKTEVESVKYVQGFDGTCGYFGVSLAGDDYLGDGTQLEVNKNYYYDFKFNDMILVNGVAGKAGDYGLFNLGANGKGYFSFAMYIADDDMKSITIPAGTRFPTRAMTTLRGVNGNPVYIMYEVETEITFYKQLDGTWSDSRPEGDFDTSVTQVQFGRSTNIINFNLGVNDYPAPNGNDASTYNIAVDAEKILALNFLDNVIVDGYTLRARYNRYGTSAIGSPWFWVNRFVGHNFAVRIPTADGQDIAANKIVIRAGTQFPSMSYLNNGTQVFYVTTEEITYVRVSDNYEVSWAKQAKISFVAEGDTIATLPYTVELGINGEIPEVPEKEGYKGMWETYTLNGGDIVVNAVYVAHDFTEVETNISKMEFAEGFVILYLTNNDYPNNEGTLDVKDKMSALHFYDYLEVDGKMMSSGLMSIDGAFLNVWNKFGSIATYLPGHIAPTQKVVIKKGCQIPSNAYRLDGSNLTCYVLTQDVTFINEGGVWVRQSSGEGDEVVSSKPAYENDYVISDLYQSGMPASAEFEKGYIIVNSSTNGSLYGYNTSNSFSISFDFSLELGANDLSALGNYTTMSISVATRGYNSKNVFGWNFYLYRPGNPNKCVEFYSMGAGLSTWESVGYFDKGHTYKVTLGYKVIDEATGTVEVYLNIDGNEDKRTFALGADVYRNYLVNVDTLSFETSAALSNVIRVSDPDMTAEDGRYNVTLSDGQNAILSDKAWKYTLPALNASEYADEGNVFIGWTTNTSTLETLYPAGYAVELTKDTTFYPVWLYLNMRDGAAVRTVENESGIRFLVDVNGAGYQLGISKNLIVGTGTLVVPTSYLDSGVEFVHESFPAGYYLDIATNTWMVETGDVWTYAAALVNISPAQYTRAMSARGYLKIAYSDGSEAYVYTAYSKDLHSRSIYDVATAAYKDNNTHSAVTAYVNSVADVTINGGFEVSKSENSVGTYTVTSSVNNGTYTINFSEAVKAVSINGARMVAGYENEIVIGGKAYVISDYKLSSNGKTITFTMEAGDSAEYYSAIAQYYANSTEYTEMYKNEILSILGEWNEDYSNDAANEAFVAKLASIKTEAQLRKNAGVKLATPVVNYGAGYAVTWNAVANADYYLVTDSNDYRNGVYVYADSELTYKPEVVGAHNVTVTAYSFYKGYATSNASASFATVEVKPVFSYKAMADGLYKFNDSQMSKLGLSTSGYYKYEGVYFAYYNAETNTWSPNEANATDWTSPSQFPAHAARLKAMGNNIILMSEGSAASLKENSVWETSRTKYIMDTAWTLGMKVIVCDDVIYQQSKEVDSKSDATNVINGRLALMEKYINHPAFFGFSLEDEPEPNSLFTGSEMESVGFMVQALKEKSASYGYSAANGNEPFFLACLYQYASGFEIGAIGGVDYDEYLKDWFDGTGLDYVYVDLYTGHAMGDETNRYEMTYDVVYGNGTNGILGIDKKFYQVITAHTQSKDYDGILTEADMYMSMLYAAAHNVAGYSWFCYFPIVTEMAGSMVGFDGNGYGNGIGNNASGSYYNAAKSAAYQYELIQGVMNGYKLASRNYNSNLLTTTLTKSGAGNITMYVNADTMNMSAVKTVTASGSACYLIGIGVGTADAPYQVVSGSVTLQPGQAVICVA